MNILLVDDEPEIRELLGEFLEVSGHAVQVCENGLQAWEWLQSAPTRCDVVIADIKMPIMDGPELLRRILADDLGVPVIFVSGHVNASTDDAVNAGAFAMVHKPFRLQEITALLTQIATSNQVDT